jgi:hypothetical protein
MTLNQDHKQTMVKKVQIQETTVNLDKNCENGFKLSIKH